MKHCVMLKALFLKCCQRKFIMCHIWKTGKLFINSYNDDRDNLWDKIFFGNLPPSVDIYFNYYDETYWCLLNWHSQVLQKKNPYVPYLKKGEIICKMIPIWLSIDLYNVDRDNLCPVLFNARGHLVSRQPFLWEHFNLQENWRIFQRLPDRFHQVVMLK